MSSESSTAKVAGSHGWILKADDRVSTSMETGATKGRLSLAAPCVEYPSLGGAVQFV